MIYNYWQDSLKRILLFHVAKSGLWFPLPLFFVWNYPSKSLSYKNCILAKYCISGIQKSFYPGSTAFPGRLYRQVRQNQNHLADSGSFYFVKTRHIVKRIFAIRIACKQALATCPLAKQPHCRFAAVWQELEPLPD